MWYVQQNIDGHNPDPSGYAGLYYDPYGYKSIAQAMRETSYDRCVVKKFKQLADETIRNRKLKTTGRDVE